MVFSKHPQASQWRRGSTLAIPRSQWMDGYMLAGLSRLTDSNLMILDIIWNFQPHFLAVVSSHTEIEASPPARALPSG